MNTYYADDQVALHLGDCIEVMREIPDASVDAVVCDPPYSLTFMGREWDHHDTPRDFQAWCEQWATECLRVLRPGGHLLAFGAPRTYHRLAAGIEDAGFEVRDSIHWVSSQGMPKGQDIAKSIDRRRDDRTDVLAVTAWLAAARDEAGWTNRRIDALWGFDGMAGHWTTRGVAACVPTLDQWTRLRETLGFDDAEILPLVEELNARKGEIGEAWARREVVGSRKKLEAFRPGSLYGGGPDHGGVQVVTAPASQDAKHWEGWNTQLKPAHEPVVVARKSTGFNTTVANVLEWGTGALNIDACRTEVRDAAYARNAAGDRRHAENRDRQMGFRQGAGRANDIGRWPTNTVFSHSGACAEDGECAHGCPVVELDAQSGVLTSGANPTRRNSAKFQGAYGEFEGDRGCVPARGADSGGASRFFPVFRYESKAPASERPRLIDGTQWPTVKPVALMRWLVRLVTPPGGVVLDPFCGSGATGEAAITEGFDCILIERDPVAAELAKTRLSKPLQPSLFGGLDEPEAT